MSYIRANDIKSHIAQGFDLTPYIAEADQEINDLAERLGVRDTSDIETNPLHFQIKRYAIEYVLFRLCEDKAGIANPDSVEFDKYMTLTEYHKKRFGEYRSSIGREMITGNVNEIRDRATRTAVIFRG